MTITVPMNMKGSLMGAKKDHVAVGDRLNSVSSAYPDSLKFTSRRRQSSIAVPTMMVWGSGRLK